MTHLLVHHTEDTMHSSELFQTNPSFDLLLLVVGVGAALQAIVAVAVWIVFRDRKLVLPTVRVVNERCGS